MSELHKGEALAKALRSICNFLPRFTRVVGKCSSMLSSKASVGNSGPK